MQIYLENQNILCEVDLSESLEVTAENFGRVEFCSDTEDYNIFVPIKDTELGKAIIADVSQHYGVDLILQERNPELWISMVLMGNGVPDYAAYVNLYPKISFTYAEAREQYKKCSRSERKSFYSKACAYGRLIDTVTEDDGGVLCCILKASFTDEEKLKIMQFFFRLLDKMTFGWDFVNVS